MSIEHCCRHKGSKAGSNLHTFFFELLGLWWPHCLLLLCPLYAKFRFQQHISCVHLHSVAVSGIYMQQEMPFVCKRALMVLAGLSVVYRGQFSRRGGGEGGVGGKQSIL